MALVFSLLLEDLSSREENITPIAENVKGVLRLYFCGNLMCFVEMRSM
jgi:hypothetical protein